jgi:polyhydroxybutyrate depolymerase
MRRVLLTVVLATLGVAAAAQSDPPGDSERTIRVDGRARRYLLHMPPASAARPLPLVLAFHGGGSNPEATVRLTGLNAKADREGFAVVYPAGRGRLPRILTWNAGACCGFAVERGVDDVKFIAALLDDVSRAVRIDARRVYATGISNGGQMAYRLAVDLPGRIAAIAPVAGSLEVPVGQDASPMPVLHFHGTADEHVPFEGGMGPKSVGGVAFQSVSHSVGTWVRVNGCRPTPRVSLLPDRADDGTRVERREYQGCDGQADVALVVIRGGGHTWPGTPRLERLLGVATRDISATNMMWEFFARHRR